MREIVLDGRPKWLRRLTALPLHLRALALAQSARSYVREVVLFPPERRDSISLFIEDHATYYLNR